MTLKGDHFAVQPDNLELRELRLELFFSKKVRTFFLRLEEMVRSKDRFGTPRSVERFV